MWDCSHKRWITGLTVAVAAAGWLAACGSDGDAPGVDPTSEVKALNLDTGETKVFPAGTAVPAGWGICVDDACGIPPNIPCEMLGTRLCVDQPRCTVRLTCDIAFGGGLDITPVAGADGGTAAGLVGDNGSVDCHMTCVPKDPTACDEAKDAETCSAVAGCTWAPSDDCYTLMNEAAMIYPPLPPKCPMVCRPGRPLPPPPPVDPCEEYRDPKSCGADQSCEWHITGACDPCPAGTLCFCDPSTTFGVCTSKPAPEGCYGLDEQLCAAQRECVWQPGPCMLCPSGSDPNCGTCPSMCQPRPVPPPPPPPTTCSGLRDQQRCEARSECMWLPIEFDYICLDGAPCRAPERGMGKCVDKPAPQPCSGLTERECLAHGDQCEWGEWVCPMLGRDCAPGAVCPPVPCLKVCHPKKPVPPPPPPPSTCEQIGDARTCQLSPGCEWELLGQTACVCPASICACPAGVACDCPQTPPCDCPKTLGRCVTKPADPCVGLDRATCAKRPNQCVWHDMLACPAIACISGDCPPCNGVCAAIKPPVEPGPCYVGGCSGEICSATPGMASVCIYPPVGGLPPKGAVCARDPAGRCGWVVPVTGIGIDKPVTLH